MSVLKKSQGELATKADIAPLASKNDLLELKVDIVKWVGGLMLAQVAIIAALVKLLWVFDGSDKTRKCLDF